MIFSLPADARVAVADRKELLRAVRRALMALSRDDKGNVPPLFSGHEPDGAPASSGRHRHVFLACADLDGDGLVEQLIVAAPWGCDRSARPGRGERAEFDRVAALLEAVRAGRLGVIPLRIFSADQRLSGPARIWESHTDYRPARHAGRGKDAAAPLLSDVAPSASVAAYPSPKIELVGPIGRPERRRRCPPASPLRRRSRRPTPARPRQPSRWRIVRGDTAMTDDQLEFHLPAPPVTGEMPLIPARMVNEFVYCPRLAYLMWTQGEWAETGDTVEGHRVHARVDRPNAPLPAPQALDDAAMRCRRQDRQPLADALLGHPRRHCQARYCRGRGWRS